MTGKGFDLSQRVLIVLLMMATPLTAGEVAIPEVTDSRLTLSLVASEPQIVTPVALAANQAGDLFVLETNTHARDSNYRGAANDRVFVFHDSTGDGQLDEQRVCLDGLQNALSMAFSSDGRLFVLQMKSVLAFRDSDGDGTFESPQTVLTIETDNNNHHGVFLALALDDQDRLYVSLGNIGGQAYTIEGTDGKTISGQGDTGLIVRLESDGSDLIRFAHGFWNPCDLKFDSVGRLLATDNDPDARGPNRVLHIIQGGRYGYQARFGASGRHPFDSWNGELPGTLPMLAGVGEAPVGLLDCDSTSLPEDYAGDLLVAIWGTNRVDRVRTRSSGATLVGDAEPLILGNEDFRPTGIVATADGTVYIADWADRRYPVHGKGRLWRLSVNDDSTRLQPALPFSKAAQNPYQEVLPQLASGDGVKSLDVCMQLASGPDVFTASAAVTAMGRSEHRTALENIVRSAKNPDRRLAALLALRDVFADLNAELLRQALRDADPRVRQTAMIGLGESMRLDLADALAESMSLQTVSPELFETFLATSQLLTDAEAERVQRQIPGTRINRDVDQTLVRRIFTDREQSDAVRAMALRFVDLSKDANKAVIQELIKLAGSTNPGVAREAIRTLADARSSQSNEAMLAIARDVKRESPLRADAIMSIDPDMPDFANEVVALVRGDDRTVSLAAARALGRIDPGSAIGSEIRSILDDVNQQPNAQRLTQQLRFALGLPEKPARPKHDEQWDIALSGGDAEAGRHTFFDRRLTCAKCHRVDGRGGAVGPDLSNIASAKTPRQILDSILDPSKERSPDYQGYAVVLDNGQTFTGTQFHFRGEKADLLTVDGKWIRFALADAEDYRALDKSLMPEGLTDLMSVAELQDLMAYLTRDRD